MLSLPCACCSPRRPTTANDGHFGPLLPFARACADADHEVRVAAPASYAAALARVGLVHEPFADVPSEVIGPIMARLPTLSFEEADDLVVREVFGRVDAQAALPGVLETVERWRPHVVVRESAELASLAGSLPPFAGVFREALDALAGLDVCVLMTVGRGVGEYEVSLSGMPR